MPDSTFSDRVLAQTRSQKVSFTFNLQTKLSVQRISTMPDSPGNAKASSLHPRSPSPGKVAYHSEPSPSPSTTASEEPYSIFDRRQKAFIVFVVSTAATCRKRPVVQRCSFTDSLSFGIRLEHILSRFAHHRSRSQCLYRTRQLNHYLLPYLSGHSPQSLGSFIRCPRPPGRILLHLRSVPRRLHWSC